LYTRFWIRARDWDVSKSDEAYGWRGVSASKTWWDKQIC
jgi:hypothetical protein